MANDLKLQSSEGTHPVDENMRPILVGGKSTAIETAQQGDGARVSGDLSIVGGNAIGDTPTDPNHLATKNYVDGAVAAGTVIGYTRIANDTAESGDQIIDITTSMTVLQTENGTDVSIAFTAPSTGNVEILFTIPVWINNQILNFALSDATSFNEVDETHTYDGSPFKKDDGVSREMVQVPFVLTGLSSGGSYTYYLAAEVDSGTAYIRHGQSGLSAHYPPIIAKATALPSITTGN